MRWLGLMIALAALGCGGNTASKPAANACSGGPAAWNHTTTAGQGLSIAVGPVTNDILLVSEPGGGNDTLTRMTASGQELWHQSRPGARRVAFGGNGDAFVSGNFSGSLGWNDAALTTTGSGAGFVARLDSHGAVIWAHKLEADGGSLTATALASSGKARLAALFEYDLDSPGPNPPVIGGFLLVELDASGNELWHSTLSPREWVGAAAVDQTGALLLTGARPITAPRKAFVTRWRP